MARLTCLMRIALAFGLGLFWLFDMATSVTQGFGPGVLVPLSGAAISVLALITRIDLERRAAIAVAISLSVTAVLSVVHDETVWGFAETWALALLLVVTVRRCAGRQATAYALLLGLSMVLLPNRTSGGIVNVIFIGMMLAMLAGTAIGVGAYLRSVDNRRIRAVSDIRQSERLELARDLHDFVAHHITGIVVQTQAARYVAQASPEQTAEMLGTIEGSAVQALSSMRRLVSVLREDPAEQAATRPAGDLTQVAELVHEFGRAGPPTTLDITPSVAARDLPPEIATTIHRVVQESLTNARKYAGDATTVRVGVHERGPGIEVAVRDDGRGAARRVPREARGGGFGLVGLTERVAAAGGRLYAGVRPEGGWEVLAWFPDSA